MGILSAAKEMLQKGGKHLLEDEMPDERIDQLSVVGRPYECAKAIEQLAEAGADTVVLVPLPDKDLSELDVFSQELLPMLQQPAI